MPSFKGNACLYCLNCTKFGQLILRKIIKIIATRCQILRLKCIKFDFRWGSAPDLAQRAHSAPPDPPVGINGVASQQGGGTGRMEKGRERDGEGGEEEGEDGREKKGRDGAGKGER